MGFPELWLVKEVARKKKITLQKALTFILKERNAYLEKKAMAALQMLNKKDDSDAAVNYARRDLEEALYLDRKEEGL